MEINKKVLEQLNWRYAVKKFDPTLKITDANWKVLEESLRLAPSSYGMQPWKFIIVKNEAIRKELKEVSWNQTQVTDCSHYVVLTYRTKITEADLDQYMNLVAKTRGAPVESLQGFRKMLEGDLVKGPRSENIHWWAQKQCYIAMGMLMETAALLEIDTCPLEGLDPKAYDKILKLEGTGYATVAAVACGFRAADDKYQEAPKVRYQRDEVFQVI